MRRLLIIWGLLLFSALLLAPIGCGGGNGDPSGAQSNPGTKDGDNTGAIETTVTTSPRSKAEFIQLANGLCRRAYVNQAAELFQYAKEHQSKGMSEAELGVKAYRAVVVPKIPTQIGELRALGAPKGDKPQIEAFLGSLKRIVNSPDRLLLRELTRAGKLARAYGIDRCA